MNELAAKGHNKPPSDIEILSDTLTLKHVHIIRAAEGHVELIQNMPDHFADESEASWTTDHIKLMQNCVKELERRRKEDKEPFLRQGQYVDVFFGEYSDKLKLAITKCSAPLNDWLQRKARQEQEAREADAKALREIEAARLAAVAEVVIAPSNVQELADAVQSAIDAGHQAQVAEALVAQPVMNTVHSVGKTAGAGLAKKWEGKVVNRNELDIIKLRPYFTEAAIDAALKGFIAGGGRECAGTVISEVVKVKVK